MVGDIDEVSEISSEDLVGEIRGVILVNCGACWEEQVVDTKFRGNELSKYLTSLGWRCLLTEQEKVPLTCPECVHTLFSEK